MGSKLQLTQTKKQLAALLVTGVLGFAGFSFFNYTKTPTDNTAAVIEFQNTENKKETTVLYEFDPNELDAGQWKTLGFTEKQVATILKYKEVVGGEFNSKAQFSRCYAVSDEKYAELEPYLLLPEKAYSSPKTFTNNNFEGQKKKKDLQVRRKFNPDLYSVQQWMQTGFSDKQASAIVKYRNYLGGSFVSKEKFRECFIINDENYRKLEPYLLLPEKTPENFTVQRTAKEFPAKQERKIEHQPFDPNTTDLEGWKSLGFSEKQAQVIINYRDRNLKGGFTSLEEIKNCFVISDKKFEELKPYIVLNPENFPKRKTAVTTKPAEKPEASTDFSKTDLNQITYRQLIEFGFSEKSAGNLIGFRKKLGGFVNKNQIFETYDIDRELAEKLTATAPLLTNNVEKYTLATAPESWLKTHPYFRYSADKIIFYRVTEQDEKKIWKFIKVKPEYEAKMRLYLQ